MGEHEMNDAIKPAFAAGSIAPSAAAFIKPSQWPLQRDCLAFYGDPRQGGWLGDNTTFVKCPWPLHIEKMSTDHILIHKKCSESLARVLNKIWDSTGHSYAKISALRYDIYDGSYNLRPMRGSNNMSMHAFACAIDWDAKDNTFHSQKHLFTDDSLLVIKFKEEGWVWGGDWNPGTDAMHMQAARIHP
jgi:D-alanyl-D-alanine carboxypeptidase